MYFQFDRRKMETNDISNKDRKQFGGNMFNIKLMLDETNAYKKRRFLRRGAAFTVASAVIIGGIYYTQFAESDAFLYGAVIGLDLHSSQTIESIY